MYCITKWTKHVTDSGKDEFTGRESKFRAKAKVNDKPIFRFRLLDDDGVIYAYGLSTNDSSFSPMEKYGDMYGITDIQYRNEATGKYESL